MARADLLLNLIKHGLSGNRQMFKKVAEAVIAEERNIKHTVLADKMETELNKVNPEQSLPNTKPIMDNRIENFIIEISPKKTINDLILPNNVVQVCNQVVQEQHRFELLRSYGLEPRNRILLIGPPGNGKTSLAEALAESLMVPLFVVRYEGIIGTYLGETAVRLRKLIEYASTRKCVLFFDEFETLGKERGDTHETGEIKRVVSSLLLQIDSLPSHVFVIGATNHPELLDRAVWRRFQVRINLPLPTRANIEQWFDNFQRKHKLSFEYASSTLAKKLLGSNYAEIEEFGISVLRKYVLSLPDAKIKDIISREMNIWHENTVKIESQEKEVNNC